VDLTVTGFTHHLAQLHDDLAVTLLDHKSADAVERFIGVRVFCDGGHHTVRAMSKKKMPPQTKRAAPMFSTNLSPPQEDLFSQ
jgi:hypothetical protein